MHSENQSVIIGLSHNYNFRCINGNNGKLICEAERRPDYICEADFFGGVYRGVELGNKHFPEVEFTIKEVSHIAMEEKKIISTT